MVAFASSQYDRVHATEELMVPFCLKCVDVRWLGSKQRRGAKLNTVTTFPDMKAKR